MSALQLPISAFSKALDCKDSANERNVSSLTNCRVQPILCKDSANERNVSSLTNCRVQPILCKDTEKKQNGIKKTIVLFVTYHKMNKKLLLSGKQIQQIQPRLMPRGFSVELLHTDSAEDTVLELGIVIIKKEHPSLLFHQKDALSWLFFCLRVNYYLIIIFMFCEPMRTTTTL